MARILVTGGGGFVGRAICEALAARGDEAWAVGLADDPAMAALAATKTGIHVAHADMSDAAAVEAAFDLARPDAVVHCAAIVGVLNGLASPTLLYRVNIEGAVNVFEAMARHNVSRMIHISSEETYGDFQSPRIGEDHPQTPTNPYGISKMAVEHIGRCYKQSHGLDCINLRTSWVYGPDFPRDRVPVNMARAAVSGLKLHVPNGADSRIDHTYLADIVEGTLLALDHLDHPYDSYHIASDSSPSLAEIAEIIADLVPGAAISVGPGAYTHAAGVEVPKKGALNCDRACETFGYVPRYDIRSGLAAYIAHLQQGRVSMKEGL